MLIDYFIVGPYSLSLLVVSSSFFFLGCFFMHGMALTCDYVLFTCILVPGCIPPSGVVTLQTLSLFSLFKEIHMIFGLITYGTQEQFLFGQLPLRSLF